MRTSTGTILLLAVLAAGSLFWATGCKDDKNPVGVKTPPIVEPDTAFELVSRFRSHYEARNAEKYLALLDPDFRFLLQSETIQAMPSVGTDLDFTEEERIHQRMFSGEAVTDPVGDFQPGVLDIEFEHFEALGGWSETDDETLFPDSVWALYEVELVFDRGPNFGSFRVVGQVKIYARTHTDIIDGQESTYFRLAGMVDFTLADKSTENPAWGLIKAFYS